MRQFGRVSMARALFVATAGLVCLPAAALAQMAPTSFVERTPNYTLELAIGPAEAMMSDQMMDSGMAANHHVEVQIAHADSDTIVMDVTPIVRITDKSSSVSRELPHVMGMSGSMGLSDFHYGQNVFVPDGTYLVTVMVGPSDTAMFRDVVVAASPMMMAEPSMSHDMGMSHDMSMSEGTARDGRMFSQESVAMQALFTSVWGERAAQEWVREHNANLPG
jgi:hypothetical protein